MSVRIMAALWDMPGLSPVEKLVLLALADWANDDGECWPSIKQIADKTGCGERTVQRAFRTAEAMGILKRHEVAGKGNRYTLDPRQPDTPATKSPPPHRRDTPATVAPNTSEHTKTFPNGKDNKRAKPAKRKQVQRPDDVSPDLWDDFLAHRKFKRAIVTERVLRDFRREAEDVGWSLERAIQECITRGWQGFQAKWILNDVNRNQRNSEASNGRGGRDGFLNACLDAAMGGDAPCGDPRRAHGRAGTDRSPAFPYLAAG